LSLVALDPDVSSLPSNQQQHHLHLLTSSLLPPVHGLIDRLSEPARTRDPAKEALVELGVLAFKEKARIAAAAAGEQQSVSSKKKDNGEEPSAAWETALKDQGLASKNVKIKEQVRL